MYNISLQILTLSCFRIVSMENINERFPSREVVGIDDITNARVAVERFKHRSSPFEVADTSLFRILNALDKTAGALRYIETEGRDGTMPLVRETAVLERVMEALDVEDEVLTSDTVESLTPSIFAVLSYPETPKNNYPSEEEIERLDTFLSNWERAEYSLINETRAEV